MGSLRPGRDEPYVQPSSVLPADEKSSGSIRTCWPLGVIPTRVSVPPLGMIERPHSIVGTSPIASNTWSGPPGMIAATSAPAPSPPRTAWVAPRSRAMSSFASCRSTATIGSAPASARPSTTDRPTPPQPITTADEPGSTRAVLTTAPTPVVTPQPISAPTSAGSSAGTGTAAAADTTARSPNEPTPRYERTASPPERRSRAVPSLIRWSSELER